MPIRLYTKSVFLAQTLFRTLLKSSSKSYWILDLSGEGRGQTGVISVASHQEGRVEFGQNKKLFSIAFFTMRIFEVLLSAIHRCGPGGSMCACHAAGLGSIPGRDRFPGEVFFLGFFLTCKTYVRKLQAPKVTEYHLAIIIIVIYHSLWAPMT